MRGCPMAPPGLMRCCCSQPCGNKRVVLILRYLKLRCSGGPAKYVLSAFASGYSSAERREHDI